MFSFPLNRHQLVHLCIDIVYIQVLLDDQKSKAVDVKVLCSSSYISPSIQSYISTPELIEFPTEVPGQSAYAYFYPPTNPQFQATQEEKPPLLLKSHGILVLFSYVSYAKSCNLHFTIKLLMVPVHNYFFRALQLKIYISGD